METLLWSAVSPYKHEFGYCLGQSSAFLKSMHLPLKLSHRSVHVLADTWECSLALLERCCWQISEMYTKQLKRLVKAFTVSPVVRLRGWQAPSEKQLNRALKMKTS